MKNNYVKNFMKIGQYLGVATGCQNIRMVGLLYPWAYNSDGIKAPGQGQGTKPQDRGQGQDI